MDAVGAYTCRYCMSPDVNVIERVGDEEKPIGLKCHSCGKYTFPPKPGNENKRHDRNEEWRKRWRKLMGGDMFCMWCLARESQKRGTWEIDHRIPREALGPDVFENTMPLCPECHTERHAHQRTVQHLLGRSAREFA